MNINVKNIFFVFVALLILAHTGKIIKYFSDLKLSEGISESLEPLRNCPVEAKYVLVLLTAALLYATVFVLICRFIDRNRKE